MDYGKQALRIARDLIGTRAALTSTDKRKGLCCYGLIWHCHPHLQDRLPEVDDVYSLGHKRQILEITKYADRVSNPKPGCVAAFNNNMLGRNGLSELHLAVVSSVSPDRVIHADMGSRKISEDTLTDLFLRGLSLIGYWRAK
jgi:hypothetical protein